MKIIQPWSFSFGYKKFRIYHIFALIIHAEQIWLRVKKIEILDFKLFRFVYWLSSLSILFNIISCETAQIFYYFIELSTLIALWFWTLRKSSEILTSFWHNIISQFKNNSAFIHFIYLNLKVYIGFWFCLFKFFFLSFLFFFLQLFEFWSLLLLFFLLFFSFPIFFLL